MWYKFQGPRTKVLHFVNLEFNPLCNNKPTPAATYKRSINAGRQAVEGEARPKCGKCQLILRMYSIEYIVSNYGPFFLQPQITKRVKQ